MPNCLVASEFKQGKFSEGLTHWEKALALSQESGDKIGFAEASCGLAILLIRLGEFEKAVYPNDQALRAWHLVGREKYVSAHIAFLGIILANIGSRLEDPKGKPCFAQAVTLVGIADTQCPPDDGISGYYRDTNRSEAEQILHTHLSSEDYAAAWSEGQSMTLEEGVALAAKIAEAWNIQA
jgi:tetratricopeptide (TPR) repeat protein